MTDDRILLAALVDHSTAPRILDIHVDDCEDDACTGCEPRHLAEKATARARLEVMAFQLATGSGVVPSKVFTATLDAYRAEVLNEAADRVAHLLEATPEYGLWVATRLREMAAEAGGSRG
ncbi:hypothetical protein ACWENO_14095 [Streptomyces sp. NPDC004436]